MSSIKFTKGEIKINKKNATITIPIGIAKQLYDKANGTKDMYFTVNNGVLQASVEYPNISIPPMILNKNIFIPQKD